MGARLRDLTLLFVLAAMVLLGRLLQLQVLEKSFWDREGVKARTQSRAIPFRRGSLFDARGVALASSESVYDLNLIYAEMRRKTQTGRLQLAEYLRTGTRPTFRQLFTEPRNFIEPLANMTVAQYRQQQPLQRRRDLCVYTSWLLGHDSSNDLIRRLNVAMDEELFCPELAAAVDGIVADIFEERRALTELSLAIELEAQELTDLVDQKVQGIDQRVHDLLARGAGVDRPFEAERELHHEQDGRTQLLVKNVPHAAIFELLLRPETFAGVIPLENARRIYADLEGLPALMIGAVGSPRDAELQAAAEHSRSLSSLLLKPALTHAEAAEMDRLRTLIREVDYRPDEEAGRYGLESIYENALRGRRGFRRVETDRLGRVHQVLEEVPPRDGRDIAITLDSTLQVAAVQALRAPNYPGAKVYPGAFVLIELPTQKIRVLASYPEAGRADLREHGFKDNDQHWLHPRAYAPYFPPPPGSSIKPLFAAFALSAHVVEPTDLLECTKDRLGPEGHPVRCLGRHDGIDAALAITKSCNHYFAIIAQKARYQKLFEWLIAVGFGRRSEFVRAWPELEGQLFPAEVAGALKTSERGERNLMLLGFGQGAIDDVTPVQVAAAVGAFATGQYQPPTIIEKVGEFEPDRPDPVTLPISATAYQVVVEAMRQVTLEPNGTARPGRVPGMDLSGYDLATKTGTPQTSGGPDHSWFVGFFPSHAPRYAFAIFLEHTGLHGGDVCAPILQQVLEDPAFAEVRDVALGKSP